MSYVFCPIIYFLKLFSRLWSIIHSIYLRGWTPRKVLGDLSDPRSYVIQLRRRAVLYYLYRARLTFTARIVCIHLSVKTKIRLGITVYNILPTGTTWKHYIMSLDENKTIFFSFSAFLNKNHISRIFL